MSRPLIQVSDLTFHAGGKPILGGVSFFVEPGGYLTIIGPNGAGKTTLLKCLCNILKGARGSIEIAGRNVQAYSRLEMARAAAYVPQAGTIAFPFTVEEFVRMGRYVHLGPFASFAERDVCAVKRALAMTETEALKDRVINSLSGGERQRVWIAAALAQESAILLLDEPATYMDPKHQLQILRLLKSLNRSLGIAIVAVTHDVNGALESEGRILAMRDGRVAFFGSGENLLSGQTLESIYSIPFHILENPLVGKRVAAYEA